MVDLVVITMALVVVGFDCAERSRLARCACVIVLMAAVGYLAVRWLHPPYAVPAMGAYTAAAVALEWRRKVPGER